MATLAAIEGADAATNDDQDAIGGRPGLIAGPGRLVSARLDTGFPCRNGSRADTFTSAGAQTGTRRAFPLPAGPTTDR